MMIRLHRRSIATGTLHTKSKNAFGNGRRTSRAAIFVFQFALGAMLMLSAFSGAQAQTTPAAPVNRWVGPNTGGPWTTVGNWSTGAVPATGDSVVIDIATTGTVAITAMPTTSIYALTIATNCSFDGTGAGNALTLNGYLNVAAAQTFTVSSKASLIFATTSFGNIQGTLSTANNFTCNNDLTLGPNGVITGAGKFALNAGATLRIGSAAGIAATANTGNIQVPSNASGRTFSVAANYVYNGTAAQNTGDGLPTGLTGSLTINNSSGVTLSAARTITSGSLNLQAGSFVVNNLLTLGNSTATPSVTITRSGGSLSGTLQGTSLHAVTYTGLSKTTGNELSGSGFYSMTLNLDAGQTLSLDANRTIPGILTLTRGFLSTLTNTLNISSTSLVALSGSSSASYVIGKLQRGIAAGANNYTFPVGTASAYAPVTLNFGAATTVGSVTVSSTNGDHPNIASATSINSAKSVNRFWTVTVNSGIGTTYSSTLNWISGDQDGLFDYTAAIAGSYNGSSWTYPSVASRNTNSIQLNGVSGSVDLQVGKNCVATSITNQSAGGVVCFGQTVKLYVETTGANRTYQWRRNGTDISGATDSVYNADLTGTYSCFVNGDCGTATSSDMSVTIKAATVINTQPVGGSICPGDSILLSVTATGQAPVTYKWKLNDSYIDGATTSSFYAKVSGTYVVEVTGDCGMVPSTGVAVIMKTATAILSQPSNDTVCSGSTSLFRVNAVGEAPVTYQWYLNNNPLLNGTTSILQATVAGAYTVKVTSGCGTLMSTAATLTLNPLTTIQVQPNDTSITYGDNAGFNLSASGTGTLTYEWQVNNSGNWTTLSEGNTFTATLTPALAIAYPAVAITGSTYKCLVTGACGTISSNAVKLSVNKATLQVAASDASREYGEDNPLFSPVYNGFKRNEQLSSIFLNGTVTFNSGTDRNSDAGTYDILPDVSGLSAPNYIFAARENKGKLTISKATLTVSAQNASREYGLDNPDFVPVYEGFKNSDDIAKANVNKAPGLSTSATAASEVGDYDITADVSGMSSTNYLFVTKAAKGKLTIGKAPLYVFAKDASREYGIDNPVFEADYTGFRNSEKLADIGLNQAPVLITDATINSDAGDYAITANVTGLLAKNYALLARVQKGKLTIGKATLTVAAQDESREYGEDNPSFTAVYTGFRNADKLADAGLSKSPVLSTLANKDSDAGAYDIDVNITGVESKNYALAVRAQSGKLNISKATLTVSAQNASRKYGLDNPEFVPVYEGFKNSDDIAKVNVNKAPGLSTSATVASEVGTYDITADVSDMLSNNYLFVSKAAKGKLTIGKAPLYVYAKDASREYGIDNPAFEADYTGFRNSEKLEDIGLNQAPELTTDATINSDAGDYAITANVTGLLAKNYALLARVQKGKLTIGKATLTVAAQDESREYGEDNPSFTAVYTGFRNADKLADAGLSKSPVLNTLANKGSDAGSYDINVDITGVDSKNYALAVRAQTGKLNISKATLTVSAQNASREYGLDNPEFVPVYEGFKNSDDIAKANVNKAPGLSTSATAASEVGEYDITADLSGMLSTNYLFVSKAAKGKLTIGKAPLYVYAKNASREYGVDNPAFEADYTGFRNSEKLEDIGLNQAPELTTDATINSNAGDYVITANVTGLLAKNYALLARVQKGKLTIGKATLTVAAQDENREYGEDNPAFNPVFTGFRNGQKLSDIGLLGTPQMSTTARKDSDVGEYDIVTVVDGLSSANYTFAVRTLPGKLNISKATLTVSAQNVNREYGLDNPDFVPVYEGFKNSDDLAKANINQAPGLSTSATAASEVGDYDITADVSGMESNNYSIVAKAQKGKLTIGKAPLYVHAKDASREFGLDNPVFEADYTGFRNNEKLEDIGLNSSPELNTEATSTSSVGVYDITANVTGLLAKNYALLARVQKGKLTIGKATLTVAAQDENREYGEDNPVFSPMFTGFRNGQKLADIGLVGTPQMSTTARKDSDVGEYAIVTVVDNLSSENYAFSVRTLPGKLTIGKATLTVAAQDASREYGVENPVFIPVYEGFKNSDDIAKVGLNKEPALSTSATIGSGVGNYDITADIAGVESKNYTIVAHSSKGKLTISKAPLYVAAKNAARAYGEQNPAFEATYTGFRNSDQLEAIGLIGAPEFSTNATEASPVGKYDIEASVTGVMANNYAIQSNVQKGALTVGKSMITVTVNDDTRIYGDANPAFTVSYSGFRNSDTYQTSLISGQPAYATLANVSSSVGSYTVNASVGTLAAPNYDFTFVPGKLSVTKATLKVYADYLSRTYGSSNPELTVYYSGFKNGEIFEYSDLKGAPLVTTPAVVSTPAGIYDINVAQGTLESGNYKFEFNNAKLTINKAMLMVKADSKRRVFGVANPDLTISYTGFVNGEDLASSDINGAPVVFTSATPESFAGMYDIIVDKGNMYSNNYAFDFENGKLVIGRALLTIKAENKTKVYGEASPKLSFTYNGFLSGETLATSDVTGEPVISASINENTPAGEYDITVSAGTLSSDNYVFEFVKGKMVVEKATVTIAAENKSRKYGESNPEFTVNYNGFVNGETLATSGITGDAAVGTSAGATTSVGEYDIKPTSGSLASDNYKFNFVLGKLTINKAQLKATAENKSRIYGQSNPDFTVAYSGFANGETLATSGITGGALVTTTATPTTPVGEYALLIANGSLFSGNYDIAFENGKLTIQKATVSITVENKEKVYGDNNPQWTVTYNGFANGEILATSGISGSPALSSVADKMSGVGVYDIQAAVGSLSASNYAFAFTKGQLTIKKALVTITAEDKNRKYGEDNPAFTASFTGFVNDEVLSNSGITGAVALSTSATLSSGAGFYDITAGLGTLASANYDFSFVKGKLTIGKAKLTVTAENKSRIYGSANPDFTVTYAGFAPGEILSTSDVKGIPQLTTVATESSEVGVYDIDAALGSLASSNYEFAFAGGRLSIGKATVTITANDQSRIYGEENPTLTASYTGFVNGENLSRSGISGIPALQTNATATTAAGVYDITIGTGSLQSANYSFNLVNGKLSIGKATLTVTAENKQRIYGQSNPQLTATITGYKNGQTSTNSGVTGTPSLLTSAIPTSDAGVYDITADLGTLSAPNYDFVFVKGSLNIGKAKITITAENKSRLYGSANPELTATYNGFVNGQILSTSDIKGLPALSTAATEASAVGTYPIDGSTGSLVSNNYDFAFVSGSLTVGKVVITVTAENKSRLYGQANPQLTVTYNGFVNGQSLSTSGISGTPAIQTSATAVSPVGPYDITVGTGSLVSTNYSFNLVNGKLAVEKAKLTITADNKSRPYGSQNPSFTASYSGFVNNETLASSGVTGTPSLTTTATTSTSAGTYDIVAGAGTMASSNYELSFAKGSLTINKVTLTVTANNKSRIYGTPNPVFNATITGYVNGEILSTSGITGSPAFSTAAVQTSKVGNYDINADLGSMAATNYDFTFVKGTLVIGKATLTITAENKTKSYGAQLPDFTAAYNGFMNGETLLSSGLAGQPLLTTTATASSAMGTYDITAAEGSLVSDNYLFTFVKGSLVIGKAAITVTADNKSRTYGNSNPSLTYQLSGFANGETLATSGVTGTPFLSTTANASSQAGAYDITVSKGTLVSDKYDFILTKGTLTINKATVTVTPDNKSRLYSGSDPVFTASFNGFMNGEILSSSDIKGQPELTTTAGTLSPVGNYDILSAVGTLTSNNYNFVFGKGVLTIGKGTLLVKADNLTRPYGSANPVLTVSYSGFANGESLATSDVKGAPSLMTAALPTSALGDYDILINDGTLTSTNYNFTLVSGKLTIGKATLTIKAEDKSKFYAQENPQLTFTYNGFVNGESLATSGVSGLPDIATDAETLSSGGTYDIVLSTGSLASTNYAFNLVKGTMTINKITLTVTADNKSRTYGAANPKFTATYTGFVNGENLISSGINGFPSLTTAATATTPVGSYDINASIGSLISANYTFVFAKGKLNVDKATITVTAVNKTKIYGSTNPSFAAAYTGFMNGETLATSGITGTPDYTTPATAASPVGTYDINITQGTLAAGNYNFTMAKGTLSVGKATITVTADSKVKVYSTLNPALTASLSGFVNGESLSTSGVTGTPDLVTNATETSPAGNYDIIATLGTLASSNYLFIFSKGVLTINKATINVIADNKTKIYGAANPVFTASYTGFVNGENMDNSGISGAPVVTSIANTSSSVGNYDIVPAQGTLASSNYAFNFVKGTLTVDKATLTVTADNKNKVYGAVNPAFSVTYTGFVNNETPLYSGMTGTPSFTTLATTASPVGVYDVMPGLGTLAAPNYTFVFAKGALTVGKAILTVTVDNKSKVYGSTNPVFTATFSGFVNGENMLNSGVTGAPVFTTPAVASSPVGNYEIAATGGTLASSNYDFTYVKGVLSIGKAMIMVTADAKSRTYGAANPAFTATYTGFVNGETLATSSISGQPSLTTAAVATTNVGVYPITAAMGTLVSSNYNFSFTNGTLNIEKAMLNVNADNKWKSYGAMNPALTATISGFMNGETLSTSGVTGLPGLSTTAVVASSLGVYPIMANIGSLASGNYNFNFINGDLTIGKATLTITAQDKIRTYGAANPEFTVTYSGFVNGESLATSGLSGKPDFITSAVATSPVGNYVVTPIAGSLTSANYSFVYVNGNLAIEKALVTVVADNKNKVYGVVNPQLTASYVGLMNGESFATSGINGAPSLTTTATTSSSVGSYDINASNGSLSSGNYKFQFSKGVLSIGKATITVVADNKSKIYGSSNPALTASYSGFVNGENLSTSGITGSPVITTAVNNLTPVGNYDITISAGTLAASNYDFTYSKGNLAVNKATVTITAEDKSKIYGDANPIFTSTFNGFVNGENLATSGISGTPSLTTAANAFTGTGVYAIVASTGTLLSDNYSFAFQNGKLTIGKATVTVTADNKRRLFGEANPDFTAAYTGFVNGETLASSGISGSPELFSYANPTSTVGNYDIFAATGSLSSSNYKFNFVSGVLTVGKTLLTITADNKSKLYGQANPALTITYNGFVNGQTFATSGIKGAAALALNTNELSPVGNYPINITNGSLTSADYDFAFVNGNLEVQKATLDVRADNKTKIYGQSNPDLTATITGFVNGEILANSGVTGSADLTTTATTASGAGIYAIKAATGSLLAANYAFNFINGDLTIGKATVTVTAENKNRKYGEQNPTFTASYNGFVNNESLANSGITGAPAFSTLATAASSVGNYEIKALTGSLAAANYTFTFANGLLTIGKATLTVTADNKSKIYGAVNPAFTASYTGFMNNESLSTSGVSGAPAYTTVANELSPVGNYAIVPSLATLTSSNYDFALANGTLTVTKAMITVTADNKTKAYGSANPVFSATYTGFVNSQDFSTSKISGTPQFTTRATDISWPGTYPIFAAKGTLASDNYDFTYVNGALAVVTPTCNTAGTLVVSDKCYGGDISLTYNNVAAPGPYTLIINDTAYRNVFSGVPFKTGTIAKLVPENIFGSYVVGEAPVVPLTTAIEVGVKFRPTVSGEVSGVRFYKLSGNTGTHVGSLWSTDGTLLARATFTAETATGWQEVRFSNPVEIIPGATYVASYSAPNGNIAYTANAFQDNRETNANGSLMAIKATDGGNGVYNTTLGRYPNKLNGENGNYYVDVVFNNTAKVTRFALTGVISATGCSALDEINSLQSLEVSVEQTISSSMNSRNPDCLDGGNGTITLAATGCNGPFYYSIDSGATYQTSGTFENLAVGTYKVRIKDAYNFAKDSMAVLSVETAVWTGSVSTDWHNAANWNTNKVPSATTHVIIPPTGKECLITAADVTIASVQVQGGAILRAKDNRKIYLTGKCGVLPNQ